MVSRDTLIKLIFWELCKAMYVPVQLVLCVCLIFYSCVAQAVFSIILPVELSAGFPLTNHTARVVLNSANSPNFVWSNSCNDITVVDAVDAPLNYYVESCDVTNQQVIVWINVPNIPASPGTVLIKVRYHDDVASSTSNAAATFNDSGFKYHTQPYNDPVPGPQSRAQGDAIFNYDQITTDPNYGCTQLGNIATDNSTVFGSNVNIGYHVLTFFDVGLPGNYEFRYGPDFGHGGEFVIDSAAIEEDWSDDLWWGFNYSHPDVLTGSVFLSAGTHKLEMLGFELCCDGPAGLQYRPVGGAWTNFNTSAAGLSLLAPDCPAEQSSILTDQHLSRVELSITKSVSDDTPRKNTTVTFSLLVENAGPFDGVDVEVSDVIPSGFSNISNISHSGIYNGSNEINWVIPSIPAGTDITLTFDVTVI